MCAWPPLTRDFSVAVSLWLCLANMALMADATNLSLCPSWGSKHPALIINPGLKEVPVRRALHFNLTLTSLPALGELRFLS